MTLYLIQKIHTQVLSVKFCCAWNGYCYSFSIAIHPTVSEKKNKMYNSSSLRPGSKSICDFYAIVSKTIVKDILQKIIDCKVKKKTLEKRNPNYQVT